jgi:hypothetical protein
MLRSHDRETIALTFGENEAEFAACTTHASINSPDNSFAIPHR